MVECPAPEKGAGHFFRMPFFRFAVLPKQTGASVAALSAFVRPADVFYLSF